ncbi:MAG: 4Fe-4S binding protein [Planctomycetaceae bacterium]|nr:4Fe-4S binding protein [Planctomycetaceae bacterium]
MMILKTIRVFVALFMIVGMTLFFVDFTNTLPLSWHLLGHIQLVPAILSVSILLVIIWTVFTIFLGRVYCSFCCPLGILQDVVTWFGKRIHKKYRHEHQKPSRWWRHGILAFVVVAFFTHFSLALSLLDPYGIYGKMSTHLFRPVYLFGFNRIVVLVANKLGYHDYFTYPAEPVRFAALAVSFLMLAVIAFLAYRFGRRYCNWICPVGTLLGLISRFSIVRVQIRQTCRSCRLCEFKCKGECIDTKNKTVDTSRCVACFNCLNVCKHDAIDYLPIWSGKKQANKKQTDDVPFSSQAAMSIPTQNPPVQEQAGRRFFLATFVTMIGSACGSVFGSTFGPIFGSVFGAEVPSDLHGESRVSYKREHPIIPPGSGDSKLFHQRCTACHLCVAKCPAHIIRPAVTEHGLSGFLQPCISFEHGFCNFNCTICTEICPNRALRPVTMEEKHLLQVGQVVFLKENCIVHTQGTNCGACAEHCPTGAVSMIPYGDPEKGLTIPTTNPKTCVGCGACEYICPVRPFRAIYVNGNPTHLRAEPAAPPDAKNQKADLDHFGF